MSPTSYQAAPPRMKMIAQSLVAAHTSRTNRNPNSHSREV